VAVPPDRYDELRREWIHNHWARSEIQRARMEKLDIQIRRRIAEQVLNAPSRRDDLARNPLPARGHSSLIGGLEYVGFWAMLLFVPFGWLTGKGVYRLYVTLVPQVLRSYPIVAILWLSLVGVLIPVLYDPGPGLGSKVFGPWLAAQIPATFLIAGLFGIVEGWLAVPGALQVWPRKLAPLQMNAVDAAEVLGAEDITSPSLIAPQPAPQPASMAVPVRNEPSR
jgi:hypothetical protein